MDGFWFIVTAGGALIAVVQFVNWMNEEMKRKK